MASFGDDAEDEFENEDEEMEDVNEANEDPDGDQDQGQDDDGGDEEDDEDNEDNDNDNDNDEDDDEDQNELDSPSRRASQHTSARLSPSGDRQLNPAVVLSSPSPHAGVRSPASGGPESYFPSVRPEALNAQAYDIVPTMAAPQSTSINAVAVTPDMRWVFTGGTDGYVRMFNWVETANGKVPLTVAQKHPFVDSVMKAGSLVTYWENEEGSSSRTPPSQPDEGKWTSPVYSLAVQRQAVWLLSGLESGGINVQTCRHQAGNLVTTLKEHTNAVSVLTLSKDERSVLSGSWDKAIHDWDLQTGRVKRSFLGGGGQISVIETRPESSLSVPELVPDNVCEPLDGTFITNSMDRPRTNGYFGTDQHDLKGADEDASGSPSGSLFGEGDHGSLFGEDTGIGGGGNAFADDGDELERALAGELQDQQDAPAEQDVEMTAVGDGGPVQPPEPPPEHAEELAAPTEASALPDSLPQQSSEAETKPSAETQDSLTDLPLANGLPHFDDGVLTAPSTSTASAADLPPQSESIFLDASYDGTIRIWDRRMSAAIATITPYGGTPPWCTSACWSPDGNNIYAGRKNCTVDEFSIHKLGSSRGKPERTFRFQTVSGPVYAVRAMPNGRHLVCASQDILRIYDLGTSSAEGGHHRSAVPFTIIPGHRGGVISSIYVDPTCRFMLSAAGNRGWESGAGTEVLLGYEIASQDPQGAWHR